jgi:predicted DNA-binding transcriptional regulator YafY
VRADRLLSLVLLLRRGGRMTAAELARELEVSPRTVLRDVEALSSAGIPVYAERGREGGFALLPGFTTDLTGLTHEEALALLTAQSRATPDALGLGPAFAAAVRKVVAAMPEAARRTATDAADRVLVRQEWHGAREPEVHLAAVRRAVFAGRRLRLRYAARDEPARWRTVDPVGLVEAGGHWYLLATREGVDRTYRLSRVEQVQELDEPAHRAPGTDLEEAWQQRRARFRAPGRPGDAPGRPGLRRRAARRTDAVDAGCRRRGVGAGVAPRADGGPGGGGGGALRVRRSVSPPRRRCRWAPAAATGPTGR